MTEITLTTYKDTPKERERERLVYGHASILGMAFDEMNDVKKCIFRQLSMCVSIYYCPF